MTRARDIADQQDNLGGAVAPFVAGKNKIINGDFEVWQRGTSFTPNGSTTYTADRTSCFWNGTPTITVSRQSFTPGTAPVTGYEGEYFYRFAQTVAGTGMTYCAAYWQPIEDVRTFAGQTITISFWAKADAARTLAINPSQLFGSGGSSAIYPGGQSITLTTSWARYSATFVMPSIAGKTIGAGSYLACSLEPALNTVQTIDLWGVQVEAGNVATPFQTASGSIGGELALCQRYCEKSYEQATAPGTATGVGSQLATTGNISASSSGTMDGQIFYKATKRSAPTVTLYDPAGNINKVRRTAIASANYDNLAASVDLSSENGFYVRSATSPAATQTMSLHYLATSEL